MKYIKGFDTLRAFAIIIVIIEHWWIPIDINPNSNVIFWIKGLIPDGGFGVNLFFVLSGFLITSILLEALNKNENNRIEIIKNFMIRRALRIFPIYYLTIFVLLLFGYPFIKGGLYWYLLYISNMFTFSTMSFNNFSHTWSLAVEEQFYLVWPWFIIFVKKAYLKYVFFSAMLIGIFTAVYTMKIQHNWAGFVLMPACIQAFGIGGLYAYLRLKNKTTLFLKFIVVAFPISLIIHFYWAFSSDSGRSFDYLFLTINSIISIGLINKVVSNKNKWINDYILENRLLNKIGKISYGIYLFHYVFPFFYEKLIRALFYKNLTFEIYLLDWENAYFIKLILLFLLSLLSFHLIENPILKLKKHFNY